MILGKSSHDTYKINIKSDNFKDTVFNLVGACEVVLIDCGNGLTKETRHAVLSVDKLLVIVEADLVAVMDTLKVIEYAKENSVEIIGAIINKHHDDAINLSEDNINQILQVPILGVVPFDVDVRKSLHLRHPVCYSHPDAKATVSFKKVAAKLIGEKYEEQLNKEERGSLFKYALKSVGFDKS